MPRRHERIVRRGVKAPEMDNAVQRGQCRQEALVILRPVRITCEAVGSAGLIALTGSHTDRQFAALLQLAGKCRAHASRISKDQPRSTADERLGVGRLRLCLPNDLVQPVI